MAILFDLSKTLTGSNGSSIWIDLGLIPTGFDFWIGNWTVYGAKADSFYLYTNLTGKSISGATNCKLLASIAVGAGKTITQDLYKNGTLHTMTTKSTGVEHWWINITAKSSTLANYNCKVVYTQE